MILKNKINVLVGCEESDSVRGRLERLGINAWSCDLQENRNPSAKHYIGDIFDILYLGWDALIGFPPCTHLAVSGAAWFKIKQKDGRQQEGIDFFMKLATAPINYIAIENPVGIMSKVYRRPDQIIQPYYFGDRAQKTTCLWLKGLPPLLHNAAPNLFDNKVTHVYKGDDIISKSGKAMNEWYYQTSCLPLNERAKVRSKTFPGIASAMAEQWGRYLILKIKV